MKNTYFGFGRKVAVAIFMVVVSAAGLWARGTADPSSAGRKSEAAYSRGITQTTQYGKVAGYKKDGALVWEGIPYGKTPDAQLRWRIPAAPSAWDGVRETVKETVAVQLTGTGVIGSDDSLNLTIYRPDTDEIDMPVLYYIHGGNNQTGISTEFEATIFAQKTNTVVVTVNHRLDVLGFINLPALKTGNPLEDSGNFALLDLNAALDYVIANIASFGGDPKNITVSGFSAGGRDVLAMLISPIFAGKFQKAISFSGGLTAADPALSETVFVQKFARLAVEDGKKETAAQAETWLRQNSSDVRDWLYSLPSERLVSAVGNGNIRMTGFPHIFADGAVIPKETFATKQFNRVPLILLDSASEFSIFTVNDPYFAAAKSDGSLLKNEAVKSELRFAIKYGSLLYEYANAEDVIKRIAPNYQAPIYAVKIAWGADSAITGEDMAELWGAHHGIFLPLITEKPRLSSALFPAPFEKNGAKELAALLQNYLKNFLHSGNPNASSGAPLPLWDTSGVSNTSFAQLVLDADAEKVIVSTNRTVTSFPEIIARLKADTMIPAASKQKLISTVLNGRWFSRDLDLEFATPGVWLQK
ncbi:carboxylesterase [Spirochaetia bacterium]|nr:carboxylesterase [Spirochaetia bacterium]